MAARSIGSLTLSFGLVAIPVKLYSATQTSNAISFNLLHKDCGSRLKQQYVCIKHGTLVEREDMVKGYEFAKDQYVTFNPEEIKALEEAGSQAVEISEFVPIESVDPLYFDKTYYLAPDKGAAKPYALLAEALREVKRCALGRWASRGRAHIVVLRPIGKVLAMQQLYFAAEVRPVGDIEVPAAELKPGELQLARQLIEQQSAPRFEPTAYTDELHARLEAAIQKKVEGQEISISESAPAASGKVIDLMEALRASLQKGPATASPGRTATAGAAVATAASTHTAATAESSARLGPRKGPRRLEPAAKSAGKASRR